MSPLAILSSCLLAITLMTMAALTILRVQGRRDRLRMRVVAITLPYQRGSSTVAGAGAGSGVGLAQEGHGAAERLANLFGFDPALQDHYVLRWWLALLITFGLAFASRLVADGLIGGWALLGLLPSWIFYSRSFFKWCERRRQNKLFVQFPDALAMIVRAVRVGVPVTESIRAVGREIPAPTGPEFTKLSDEIAIGVELDLALKAMAERNGLQEFRFFATALSLQSQTGGALSETLENLADVIRKRVSVRQRGEALSSEAKTSAIVLGLLPPLAAIGLYIMNPLYIIVLFTDPVGHMILAAAVAALTCGIMCMRFMIRKSLT